MVDNNTKYNHCHTQKFLFGYFFFKKDAAKKHDKNIAGRFNDRDICVLQTTIGQDGNTH